MMQVRSRDVLSLGLRDPPKVLGGAGGDVDRADRSGSDGDLVHVERRSGIEHRAAIGNGDDRERVRLAHRSERGAVDRVDRNVDFRVAAVADLLTVVEHRRIVLLALADDHGAAHAHRRQRQAHRFDRCMIGAVLVAPTDPSRRGETCGLGGPHEVHGEVAIRMLTGRYHPFTVPGTDPRDLERTASLPVVLQSRHARADSDRAGPRGPRPHRTEVVTGRIARGVRGASRSCGDDRAGPHRRRSGDHAHDRSRPGRRSWDGRRMLRLAARRDRRRVCGLRRRAVAADAGRRPRSADLDGAGLPCAGRVTTGGLRGVRRRRGRGVAPRLQRFRRR